jgi:magnesium chelatase family protein
MEDGCVLIARAAGALSYPARFTLVAATNPCPCGRAGDPTATCACSPADVARYQARLSGPLADRIDMHIHVGAVPPRAIHGASVGEPSTRIRDRVERARAAQRDRWTRAPDVLCNAHASGRALLAASFLTPPARELLATAAERLALSARAYFRVAKVARTIADLDGHPLAGPAQVAEALRFRPTVAATPALARASPA